MGRGAIIFEIRKPRLRGKTGIFKVTQQVSDRSSNHALVWAQSCRPCTAPSSSFLPSSFPPWRKLTRCVCYVTGFLSHFPSSTEKALDVVSTSSISNTSRPSSCELPRMGPGYFLSSLVLEQSVPGSCHLSCPSPGLPSNCSLEALSRPRAGSPKFISLPLSQFLTVLHQLASRVLFSIYNSASPSGKGHVAHPVPFMVPSYLWL